jgi:D-arabinose 1-dehydrogenase-like Zn-dependent alcohol dehydrogenase
MDQVRITGSATGGMKITQECINFMAEKNIMVNCFWKIKIFEF